MRKLNIRPSFLQILYLIIFIILFAFIIYTPTLIKGPVSLTPKFILEEETFEGFLICVLFIISILILNLYKREVDKHKELINKINDEKKKVEERLNDSEKYIAIMNVQIQEIKSIFNTVDKYPETKDGLKKAFNFFGDRVIGIVNSEWVLFRIIDNKNQRTVCEHFGSRKGLKHSYPHVSNKMIIEKETVLPYSYVISNPKNLNILIACIMPIDKITNDQHVFIQAIINEITKLFVILNSLYYKKESNLVFEDNTDKR
ncbi:MAG: hypothetical protein WA816_13240 [Bacteroidales bacterium]